MSREQVVIIDGGGANIASLRFALSRLGYSSELSVDPEQIAAASHVILPGVGAAASAMAELRKRGLDRLIPSLEQPVLGICLGMQLLFEASDEEDVKCLGIINGTARRLEASETLTVPHMGWNQIARCQDSGLLDGIEDGSYVYFVHSYAVDQGQSTIASTEYGRVFSAIVAQQNFMATQFHPERSGKVGAQLLRNFLATRVP